MRRSTCLWRHGTASIAIKGGPKSAGVQETPSRPWATASLLPDLPSSGHRFPVPFSFSCLVHFLQVLCLTMSFPSWAHICLFVLGLSAHATPIRSVDPSLLADISQSKWSRADQNVTTSTQNLTDVGTFNAAKATKELKSVLAKYANAGKFLAGIGLNPDTHPEEGYPRFNPPNIFTSEGAAGTPPSSSNNGTILRELNDPRESTSEIIGVPPVAPGPGTVQLPLTDYTDGSLDILYYGPMQFGSGQATLDINIDTGSADLWVPVGCRGCQNRMFNTNDSTTYVPSKRKCKITYGTGQVSGTLAEDTVAVGPVGVSHQTFCAAHTVSDDFDEEPSSGLLGLAFGSIAESGKPTFFENLLAEKKLAASVFSVHLTRGKPKGSEVCFGCYDPTKAIGPVIWNPVISRTYWSIAMDGLSINGTRSAPANLTAAVDTGTSLIYVPDDVASDFYALIPGSGPAVQYGGGFYTFPCDTPFYVSLNLGGQAYTIHPSDFNLGRTDEDSNDCVGGILALGNGFPPDLAIIGDEFLKSWYSAFDYAGRVGFARSVNNR
ncbi:aspartic peptidase domain-containing protein [Trametes punicea]|nr:aspartic peptidase domain-containing protein [Trametes punicea]